MSERGELIAGELEYSETFVPANDGLEQATEETADQKWEKARQAAQAEDQKEAEARAIAEIEQNLQRDLAALRKPKSN